MRLVPEVQVTFFQHTFSSALCMRVHSNEQFSPFFTSAFLFHGISAKTSPALRVAMVDSSEALKQLQDWGGASLFAYTRVLVCVCV